MQLFNYYKYSFDIKVWRAKYFYLNCLHLINSTAGKFQFGFNLFSVLIFYSGSSSFY